MCHQNFFSRCCTLILFGRFNNFKSIFSNFSIKKLSFFHHVSLQNMALIYLFTKHIFSCKFWKITILIQLGAVCFVWSVLSKVSSDYYDSMLLDSKVICFSQYTTLQADNFAVLVSQLSNPNWTFVWESWKLANILPPNHHHHIKSDV